MRSSCAPRIAASPMRYMGWSSTIRMRVMRSPVPALAALVVRSVQVRPRGGGPRRRSRRTIVASR
ncbi:hypothetical protein ACFPRL_03750 [Pseudoclavibacter helvolus]